MNFNIYLKVSGKLVQFIYELVLLNLKVQENIKVSFRKQDF